MSSGGNMPAVLTFTTGVSGSTGKLINFNSCFKAVVFILKLINFLVVLMNCAQIVFKNQTGLISIDKVKKVKNLSIKVGKVSIFVFKFLKTDLNSSVSNFQNSIHQKQ